MRRFILTGAPGSGKTTLARRLGELGHDVVDEAATDVIADAQAGGIDAPWEAPEFIMSVAALQRAREAEPSQAGLQFSDRSLFCTLALAAFLERPVPGEVMREAEALAASAWFQRRVLFVDQLGFIVNTGVRRITIDEATRFGAVHEEVYQRYGFRLVHIAAGAVDDRVAAIMCEVAR